MKRLAGLVIGSLALLGSVQAQQRPNSKIEFLHTDHLGNVRVVTDENGAVVATHKFLPYGQEYKSGGASANTHKFTGHERDGATNLDYMLQRYYNGTATFRFISVDPTIRSARHRVPQSWNRYLYAMNNPIIFVDANGEDIKLAPGMTPDQEEYVRDTFAQVWANPSARETLERLEGNTDVDIYLAESVISAPGDSGQLRGDAEQGVLIVVVDKTKTEQGDQAGGDSHAGNLADELKHADNAIEQGDKYDPNEHKSIDEFKEGIGPNTPTEETREEADEILDKSPPQESSEDKKPK